MSTSWILSAALLALAAVPSLRVPTIDISPLPPRQGGKVSIIYSGTPGTVLTLTWSPTGTPSSVTIPAGGTATLPVPAGATSLIVSDPTGGASSAGTVIAP